MPRALAAASAASSSSPAASASAAAGWRARFSVPNRLVHASRSIKAGAPAGASPFFEQHGREQGQVEPRVFGLDAEQRDHGALDQGAIVLGMERDQRRLADKAEEFQQGGARFAAGELRGRSDPVDQDVVIATRLRLAEDDL